VLFLVFVVVQIARLASERIHSSNPISVARALPSQAIYREWLTGAPRPFRPWTPVKEAPVVLSHRLYGFDSMTLAVSRTPRTIPFQHGATLENFAQGLVPRIVWAGKPTIGIGFWFAVNYWGAERGVPTVPQSVTHPAELWIDFGWWGVLIGLALLGVWYRFAYAALRPRESGTGAVVYTVVFLTVIVVDRDIPLVYVTLVQRLAVVALVVAALELYRRRFAPTS
jgi:hypothetical protein